MNLICADDRELDNGSSRIVLQKTQERTSLRSSTRLEG